MPTDPTASDSAAAPTIDPRSPRFGAVITSAVLALTILLGPGWGLPLLVLQALVFAAGALLGLRNHPYGWLFRTFVRPRLGAPTELEDARPPRFAQTVGLVFALAGIGGALAALPAVFYVAVGFALVAALLNAVFNFCLGCELYLVTHRLAAIFGTD
ncbi:MAG TPA: DUF4395 domain-containing protein [Propionicimonas sp.]|jgi:hypothetical protein|nr:DUF4395 domain-containing protein [Propionicimonas sp.]